jgi:GNAT superfamily N-acetyltransferase
MMRPMPQIQTFSPEYTDGVVRLILPIQQQEFGIAITADAQPDLRDIPGFYQRGAGNFWVALDGGEVVGSIGLLDIGHGQAALRKMFVRPSHRGREHGVAAALLATLLEHARDQGLKEIYLGTTDKFLAAHRFYEKHGFTAVARESLPPAFPVMAVDSVFYALRLSPAPGSA